jgi:hypothetical protein
MLRSKYSSPFRLTHAALFLCLGLSACSGGDDSADALLSEFSGTWNVRYNLSRDECGLVTSGITGFVDSHFIQQNASQIELDPSGTSIGGSQKGTLVDSQSFDTTVSGQGDFFGDGGFCAVEQKISYEATGSDTATTLFSRHIECADGFVCDSLATGRADRIQE